MNNSTLDKDIRLIQVVPSARQLKHQQLEFYAFTHFSVNTFTNNEWGTGNEDPSVFAPTALDANQWAKAVKSACMTGIIVTCKHHDGFCLWPSAYNSHNISKSPYKNGKGDIVKEVSEACAKEGLKFGVYLSPWDRNSALYGDSDLYNDYFINQLTELLTNYGEIFSVWFDGACGEGPNGKRQIYDWDRYYQLIRKLQPNACITVCGEDVRWCGNEAGDTRESEWSVVPARLTSAESIREKSQQADDSSFRLKTIASTDADLGSREALENETNLIWYPAEVDTSIRPGWFYHHEDDDRVRSLDELLHIYYNSVGSNSSLLLNIPPDTRGLIHENDVQRLQEIGDYLRKTFRTNLALDAVITSAQEDGAYIASNVRTNDYDTYYKALDGQTAATLCLSFAQPQAITHVVLKENIKLSQRIEAFAIRALVDGAFVEIYRGTVVGYQKIAKFAPIQTSQIHIDILDSRVCPTLCFVGVYGE